MTLPLTPDILRAAYSYLAETPPFSKWNLPAAEDIAFRVVKTSRYHGWKDHKGRGKNRKYIIAISATLIGQTESLMVTMGHEVVHLYMALTGMERGTGEHGEAFQKLARSVCRVHGFDPKTF